MFEKEIKNFLERKNYPVFQPKAVFFDMDGVLFDSMKYHAFAWVKVLREKGIDFTEQEGYMNEGRTGHSTINEVYERTFGREATEEEKQEIYRLKSQYFEECGVVKPIHYAYDLLKKIKSEGLQIFVVTGSGQPTLINSLNDHFPGIFVKEKMVTAFDVVHGKPSPEPYLKALGKSGVEPWEAIVVENAPLGVESAVNAGLFTIAVNTGPLADHVLTDQGADMLFQSMKDLFDHWDELKNYF